MIAGQLEIQLLANLARLQKDMDDAKRVVGGAMTSISDSVGVAKGALTGLSISGAALSFASSIKGAIDLADSLNKLSQRTGIATEDLSQLQYAAKLADVDSASLTNALKKLNVSIAEGLAGDKTKIALFKELGITTADLGNGTEAVMKQIADAYAGARDGAGKVAVGNGLMGKSAEELIPFLNAGGKAINDLKIEADKLGLTISGQFAKDAEEFNDNLTRVQVSSQKLAISLASDLVKGLGLAMKAMADATIEGGKLFGMYRGLQTLLTGDDLHKSNVAVVDGTELVMAAENALAKARGTNNEKEIARLTNTVKLRKDELATHQSYNKSLVAEAEKAAAAGKAIETARTNGRTLKAPAAAGGSSSADTEIKTYTSALQALEMQLGKINEQTQEQKTQYQLTSGSLMQLTAAHAEELLVLAREIDLRTQATAASKAALDYAKELTAEQERADAVLVAFNGNTSEYLQQLEFETKLLGMTANQREIASAQRKLDSDYQRAQIGLNKTEMDTLTALYELQKGKLPGAIAKKGDAEKERATQINMWQSIDGAARDAFVNIGKNGTNVFDKLKDSLQSGLYALLYEMTVKKWLVNISTQVSGAGAAESAFGGDGGGLGSLFKLFGFGGSGGGSSDPLGGFISMMGFANGGSPPVGVPSMVGERGPELFVPNQAGTVIPNNMLGGGGTSISNSYQINIDSRSDQASIYAGVQSMLAKNNRDQNEQLRRAGVLA